MCNSLAAWTTLNVGGDARAIAVAYSGEQLAELAESGLVLGRGSNVLVSDSGYDGTVVINRFERVITDGNVVTAGSGTRLGLLAKIAAERGLTGLECLSGIPGSVGGAVVMNAGAFGGEIADNLVYADILIGGRVKRIYKSELGFGYRTSCVRGTVIRAAFELSADEPRFIKSRMAEFARTRRRTQPRGKSAGSIFRNPQGVSVGRVLDEAGLKGYRIGGAVISVEHANIIVNTGGATALDVARLIAVMRDALQARGVTAKEEIVYVGDFGGINGVLG